MNQRYFIMVDTCPVFADIGPYIEICLQDAGAAANSIYRGDDARALLHKYGKHTQQELIDQGLPANPVDETTHCLRSDGRAYRQFPPRSVLPWWGQGFDVNDSEVDAVITAATRHGWNLFRPYPGTTEFHHLNFHTQPRRPRVNSRDWHRLWAIRFTYPRS